MKALAVVIVAFSLASPCFGQAFKCKTISGATVISDSPCVAGAKTERVQASENISPERQRQAQQVHSRNATQVNQIEGEKAAYSQQLQRQQAILAEQDASQRLARQQKAAEMARDDAAKKQANCVTTATNRRNSSMLAECEGRPNVQNRENPWDAPDTTPPPGPLPPSVIKNCSGASCSDQFGQKYTTEAGKTTRSDGKRCYQRGSVMYCD